MRKYLDVLSVGVLDCRNAHEKKNTCIRCIFFRTTTSEGPRTPAVKPGPVRVFVLTRVSGHYTAGSWLTGTSLGRPGQTTRSAVFFFSIFFPSWPHSCWAVGTALWGQLGKKWGQLGKKRLLADGQWGQLGKKRLWADGLEARASP